MHALNSDPEFLAPINPPTHPTQHTSAYEGIIKAAKGSLGEKKLAAGFITRFFQHFPTLAESAMDAMLDLIEDEDAQVRAVQVGREEEGKGKEEGEEGGGGREGGGRRKGGRGKWEEGSGRGRRRKGGRMVCRGGEETEGKQQFSLLLYACTWHWLHELTLILLTLPPCPDSSLGYQESSGHVQGSV